MLTSLLWILIVGFFAGQVARRWQAPALVGMILAGIGLGPQGANVLGANVLAAANDLRLMAVMVILMKAGLGLDRDKLQQQGSVALRLGFLPAICEAIAVAVAAIVIFQVEVSTGLLLGCIIGAESPAVIVPGMLRLKSLGWGVEKGIPDAILTGSALSNVLMLLVFGLLLAVLFQSPAGVMLPGGLQLSAWQILPLQILLQIGLGVCFGALAARCLVWVLATQKWTQNAAQDTLVAACLALFLVVAAMQLPIFSGYLAVMALGFYLIEWDAPLARRLRGGFDALWSVAEIFLFVLLGASIQLQVLHQVLLPGLLVLALGLLMGRSLGWYLSTIGSNWTMSERLFLLPGNSAKATVQAAIGAIPLAQGLAGGETILAISALSILVTAPLGAWAIPTFAPRLLARGEVDPTKVARQRSVLILAAVDTSSLPATVLTKAAELARRSDGRVLVLHVVRRVEAGSVMPLQETTQRILADIRYEFKAVEGAIAETIVQVAEDCAADEIVVGKRGHQPGERGWIGSVSQTVLESSHIPVIVVEDDYRVAS